MGRKINTENLQTEWSVCTTLWEALGWDTVRLTAFFLLTDLVGCVLVQWQSVEVALTIILEPQRVIPQALTLHGGDRFFAWRLKHPFIRECRQGPKHFWSRWVCLGWVCLGPASDPPKKALCRSPLTWNIIHPQYSLDLFPAINHFFKRLDTFLWPKIFSPKGGLQIVLKILLASKPLDFYRPNINNIVYQ